MYYPIIFFWAPGLQTTQSHQHHSLLVSVSQATIAVVTCTERHGQTRLPWWGSQLTLSNPRVCIQMHSPFLVKVPLPRNTSEPAGRFNYHTRYRTTRCGGGGGGHAAPLCCGGAGVDLVSARCARPTQRPKSLLGGQRLALFWRI